MTGEDGAKQKVKSQNLQQMDALH